MNQGEIRSFFRPGTPIFIGGLNYAVPTVSWIESTFYPFFHDELFRANVDKWVTKWECRDFARGFAFYAQLLNARSGNSPAGTDALAVGEFWFIPDAGHYGMDGHTGHAVNACITDKGLIFIDPQTGLPWEMTPTELNRCLYVRF